MFFTEKIIRIVTIQLYMFEYVYNSITHWMESSTIIKKQTKNSHYGYIQ